MFQIANYIHCFKISKWLATNINLLGLVIWCVTLLRAWSPSGIISTPVGCMLLAHYTSSILWVTANHFPNHTVIDFLVSVSNSIYNEHSVACMCIFSFHFSFFKWSYYHVAADNRDCFQSCLCCYIKYSQTCKMRVDRWSTTFFTLCYICQN